MFNPGDLVVLADSPERKLMGVSLFQGKSVISAAPWLVDLRGVHKRYYANEPPLLFLNKEEKTVGTDQVVLYHFLWGKEKWHYLEIGYDNIPLEQVFMKVNY